MKTNVKIVAERLGMTVNGVLKMAEAKLTNGISGKGKNTWFTPEAIEILVLAREVPLAVADKTWGKVLHPARNPTWVYVKIDDVDGKKPVHISRRYVGALVGKRIPIEVITDVKGTTYRHDPRRT